eukprot:SAG11_NODE_702_length_7661_cov_3.468659_6_plen_64_part_00
MRDACGVGDVDAGEEVEADDAVGGEDAEEGDAKASVGEAMAGGARADEELLEELEMFEAEAYG